MRDCIWLSAWISISRAWLRRRMMLSVSSLSAPRIARISPRMRDWAMATSPASLTMRSTSSARTLSSAREERASAAAGFAGSGAAGSAGAFGEADVMSVRPCSVAFRLRPCSVRVQSAPVQGHVERRHGQRRAAREPARPAGAAATVLQLFDQQGDAIEGGLQLFEQTVGDAAELADVDHARLHRVGELADGHGADHPRAALERVQQALERFGDEPAGWVGAPIAQISADLRNQLGGFLEEHRQQLLVDVVGDAVLAPLDLHTCGPAVESFGGAEQIGDAPG